MEYQLNDSKYIYIYQNIITQFLRYNHLGQTMQQATINLEETPFVDLSNGKSYLHQSFTTSGPTMDYTSSTYDENIPWTKIKPNKIFDQSTIDIPNQKDREIIDDLVDKYKYNLVMKYTIHQNPQLKQKLIINHKTIFRYAEEGYPKPIALGMIACSIENRSYFQPQRYSAMMSKCIQKTEYPFVHVVAGMIFMSQLNINKVTEHFDIALKYREPIVLALYGSYYKQMSQLDKAYQYYMNALEYGCKHVTYCFLGELFVIGNNITFPKNLLAAKKYFTLACQQKSHLDQQTLNFIGRMNKQFKDSEIAASEIKSTEETQAKVVSNFIKNKQFELKNSKDRLKVNIGGINNFKNSGSQGISFKQKTFNVVFAPLTCFPSRGFLAEDQKGIIEIINVYNWERIHPNKLKLLHILGTKIILTQYIRKYGANDMLPCYRIQNPNGIQIIGNNKKHCISDKRYRELARSLFSKNLYDQTLNIYNHLIMKGASQLEIIYSNRGLVYQNKNQLQQAKKDYLQSLNIKKYQKSILRLAYIYLYQKKLKEAQRYCGQLSESKEKQQLADAIKKNIDSQEQEKKKQFSEQQFEGMKLNTIKYLRKQPKIPKLITHLAQSKNNNPTAANVFTGDIIKYISHYKSRFSNLLDIEKSLSMEAYIGQLQKVYDGAEALITNNNLIKFTKFIKFSYSQFELYAQNQFYEQSTGYYWNYTRVSMSGPLILVPLGIQLASTLGKRCNYLENRLQNQCILLQKKGKLKEAQDIYRCANDHCIPFCVKTSQMLFKQVKDEQNIKYSQNILKKLQKIKENKKVLFSMIQLNNSIIKSMIRSKRSKDAVILGEQTLAFLSKTNPQYQNIAIQCSEKSDLLNDLVQKTTKCVKQTTQMIRIQELKNNIAHAYLSLKQYDEALKLLTEQALEQYDQKQNIQFLISTLLLKIKILSKCPQTKNNDRNLMELIDTTLYKVDKLPQTRSTNIYKYTLNKFLLEQNMKSKKLQNIIKTSKIILELNKSYIGYIVKQINYFLIENVDYSIQLFELLDKNDLSVVWDNIQAKLKAYHIIKPKSTEVDIDRLYQHIKQQDRFKGIFDVYIGGYSDEQLFEQANKDLIEQQQQQQTVEYVNYQYKPYQFEQQQQFNQILPWQQESQYMNQYEHFDYITHFKDAKLTYVVYFKQDINLQKKQAEKFMISASKLCRSEFRSNGIKLFKNNEARLKINEGSRLAGLVDKSDPRVWYILLDRKEGHDDYKRK